MSRIVAKGASLVMFCFVCAAAGPSALAECFSLPVRLRFIGSTDVMVAKVTDVHGIRRSVPGNANYLQLTDATLSVTRRFLGGGPSTVVALQSGDGTELQKGREYLVFATRDQGKLINLSCATLPLEVAGGAIRQLKWWAWFWKMQRRYSLWQRTR